MAQSIYHFYGVTPQFYGIPSDKDYLQMNSVQTHFWNYFLERLEAKNDVTCEVHLFTEEADLKMVEQGKLKYYFHPRMYVRFPAILNRILEKISPSFCRYLKSDPPSLFVFYCGLTWTYWPILLHLGRKKIPYAIHFHGGSLKKFKFFKRHYFRKAHMLIVPTQEAKDMIAKEYQIDNSRIAVVPCGINTEVYTAVIKKAESYPTLCFSAILNDRKSFKETIRCFAEIKKRFPRAILEVAGEYRDDVYKGEAENVIDECRVRDSVKFLGWIKQDQLREMYSRAHLLFFPSKIEPLGRSLLEAMACSTPAVCLASATGPAEIIRHNHNGLLTELPQLNQASLELLADRELLTRMSQNARETVTQRYSFESSYQRAESVYMNLVNGKKER